MKLDCLTESRLQFACKDRDRKQAFRLRPLTGLFAASSETRTVVSFSRDVILLLLLQSEEGSISSLKPEWKSSLLSSSTSVTPVLLANYEQRPRF